jgi:hypothetical protein
VVTYLPLHSRFAGSKSTKDDGFLRALKIRGTTSFGRQVKLSVPRLKIYAVLKKAASVKEVHRRQNTATISRQVILLHF